MERGNQGCSAHLAEGRNDKTRAACTATLLSSHFKRWSNSIVVKREDPLATEETVYDLTNTTNLQSAPNERTDHESLEGRQKSKDLTR